jgi:triacylglycerol esterase/lipase EstA (alpha/beta hydrolase family)
MKRLLMMMVLASQLLASASFASDYVREKKWADEVAPGLVVGDAVYLKQQNQHEFLTLYTPVDGAKSAVIVVHGLGVHPDWGLIGTLRTELADKGYTTLSVQMPVLRNEAKGDEYPPTFPEAAERLKLAVDFLKSNGYSIIGIVSHSMGSRMSYAYLSGNPAPEVKAWASLGLSTNENLGALKVAVLDMYGEKDLPDVLTNVSNRTSGLAGKAGSRQQVIPGADHFYNDKEGEMVKAVDAYLKGSLGK